MSKCTASLVVLASLAGAASWGLPKASEGAAPREVVEPRQAAEDDCLRCHEEVAEQIERDFPHGPAAAGLCSGCHSPHAARYPHLLNVRVRALCLRCHEEQKQFFAQSAVHTPVREGRCGDCHEVHGSDYGALLRTEGNALCFECHEPKKSQQDLPVTHPPFVDGECMSCHDPHASSTPDQLVMNRARLCATCHDPTDSTLSERHEGIPIERADCLSCHDAHASAFTGMLRPVVHPPFGDGMCDACHMTETDHPGVLRAAGGRLCRMCHGSYPNPQERVVHEPVAAGNCGACHKPHAAKQPHLLAAPQPEVCLSCHEEIARRAESSRSAHPLKTDKGSCTACHRPHSSKEGALLVTGAIRTCLACHEQQRHGHPVGEDKTDPRTGGPMTCVSCHDPHGTEFPMQLRGDESRGLCLECHSTEGSPDAGGGR